MLRTFTAEELTQLPPLHAARTNPALQVERFKVMTLDLPPIAQVCNREAVIFAGAAPEVATP